MKKVYETYKGYEITIRSVTSARFGTLYAAIAWSGGSPMYFGCVSLALKDTRRLIDEQEEMEAEYEKAMEKGEENIEWVDRNRRGVK